LGCHLSVGARLAAPSRDVKRGRIACRPRGPTIAWRPAHEARRAGEGKTNTKQSYEHMQPAYEPASQAVAPPKRRALRLGIEKLAYAAVIFGVLVYTGETVRAHVGGQVVTGGLEISSFSSTDAALLTLTNRTKKNQFACLKGVITHNTSKNQVESLPVCTGEVKPMTSVSLQAPYPVGKVNQMCSSKNQFGVAAFDWSQCTFSIADVTGATR
jgi:hypothetical protein